MNFVVGLSLFSMIFLCIYASSRIWLVKSKVESKKHVRIIFISKYFTKSFVSLYVFGWVVAFGPTPGLCEALNFSLRRWTRAHSLSWSTEVTWRHKILFGFHDRNGRKLLSPPQYIYICIEIYRYKEIYVHISISTYIYIYVYGAFHAKSTGLKSFFSFNYVIDGHKKWPKSIFRFFF